jgi:hypothetical protein
VTGPHDCFLFDSSQAALWAEEVARDAAVPAEVVPAPADSDAKCDLALITPRAWAETLERALEREGVAFRRWGGSR